MSNQTQLPNQVRKADDFAVFGARRGNPNAPLWPRWAGPPETDCAPIESVADFKRRVLVGVVGVLDQFDELGQVRNRRNCVVRAWGNPMTQWCVRFPDAEDQRFVFAVPFPRRADCTIDGASIGTRRWRFTFMDESGAEPRVPQPPKRRAVTDSEREAICDALAALPGYQTWPNWRFWHTDDGIYGWATMKDSHGFFWSFEYRRGSDVKAKDRLTLKDHRRRLDARAWAEEAHRVGKQS